MKVWPKQMQMKLAFVKVLIGSRYFFLFLFFVQVWIIVQRNLLSISSRNRLTLQSLSVPFIPKDKKGTRVGIVPPKKRHGEIQHPLLLARLLVELASSCRRGWEFGGFLAGSQLIPFLVHRHLNHGLLTQLCQSGWWLPVDRCLVGHRFPVLYPMSSNRETWNHTCVVNVFLPK